MYDTVREHFGFYTNEVNELGISSLINWFTARHFQVLHLCTATDMKRKGNKTQSKYNIKLGIILFGIQIVF